MNKDPRPSRFFWTTYPGATIVVAVFICFFSASLGVFSFAGRGGVVSYVAPSGDLVASPARESEDEPLPSPPARIYMPTPEPLRAIYMSQCVAGTPSFRERLIALAEETEINAIVIDVKDYAGGVAFPSDDPLVGATPSARCFVSDMRDLVRLMNRKGIYTIARITVFQDPYYAKLHPELAVKKASARDTLWSDYKGLHFIDAGAEPFWEYIVAVSRATLAVDFDELNYDYIRFPSDGNMRDIYYPWSDERIVADPEHGKATILRDFFAYLRSELADEARHADGHAPVLSADLFGMTMTNTDDLNIGQVLENALPYFDFVAPMVYPSHYPRGFNGHANPAAEPYPIIKFSMDRGVARTRALRESASTTPWAREAAVHPLQLRPWLQDFDLGAVYTADMVRAQMQAVYDAGLTSWMLWDPANTYTREALDDTP